MTRNQGKHPDRGCAKASHDDRISGRGELDRASLKKMCEKLWTLSKLCERLGMRKEGCFLDFISFMKDENGVDIYENTMIYAILKREWIARIKF